MEAKVIGTESVDEKSIRRDRMAALPKRESLHGKRETPALISIGRILFGVSMIVLGIMGAINQDFVMEWTAAPANIPARALWAYAHGGVLIVAGFGVLLERTVRLSSLALGTVWLAWTGLYLPLVIAHWRTSLGGAFEDLAIASGAFLLAAISDPQRTSRTAVSVSRYAFALCLPVFGLVHFLYPTFVAAWVPTWIPGPPIFCAYFTGVAFCAAGLAILSGVQARLASRLVATMFSSWLLIVHIPRVMAHQDRHEWSTLLIAVAISGSAWIVAGSVRGETVQTASLPEA
jgi:uncharacterized membrane protein YphA (DoxX/SURF4 family)